MDKYILGFALLSMFSVIYLRLAEYFNIIDKPNERSSHTVPIIRGGGVLFLIAVWIFFFIADFQYPYLVFGVSLIGGISFIDDLKTLSSKIRLPFQFFAIFLILAQVGLFSSAWWMIGILSVLGVGFINIYNFMDGINGITGLYSLAVLSGFYAINMHEPIVNSDLLIYIALSLLVFGYYNFRKKARFFAGDVGSISIAIVFFFLGAAFINELSSPLILLLVIVYAADAISTVFYRIFIGESITEAHRHHIYQKLVDIFGITHLKISIGYAFLQVLINYIVYKSYDFPRSAQYKIFFGIILFFEILYLILFLVLNKRKHTLSKL